MSRPNRHNTERGETLRVYDHGEHAHDAGHTFEVGMTSRNHVYDTEGNSYRWSEVERTEEPDEEEDHAREVFTDDVANAILKTGTHMNARRVTEKAKYLDEEESEIRMFGKWEPGIPSAVVRIVQPMDGVPAFEVTVTSRLGPDKGESTSRMCTKPKRTARMIIEESKEIGRFREWKKRKRLEQIRERRERAEA